LTRTMRNNAHAHVLAALQAGVQEIPFTVTGLDFDNGTEFLSRAVTTWAGERDIYVTRSPPYKKNGPPGMNVGPFRDPRVLLARVAGRG